MWEGGFGGPRDGGHYAGIMNGNLSMNILIVETRPVSGQAKTIPHLSSSWCRRSTSGSLTPNACTQRANNRRWRETGPLVPFHPELLDPVNLIGQTVKEWTPHVGTYGMGGPGFLGLLSGAGWLIVALWGAPSWFQLDGRQLEDFHWDKHGRERPLLADVKPGSAMLFVGWRIDAMSVERTSMTVAFAEGHELRLSPDPRARPPWRATARRGR